MTKFAILLSTAAAVALSAAAAEAEPHYDSAETRAEIEAMVEAHGGAERWFALPSVGFTATMYLASLPLSEERTLINNWRHYRVTIDPETSEAYVELGLYDVDGIYAAVTRDRWWRQPGTIFDVQFQDGPAQLAWYHYGMMALPFLTQVDGTNIARREDEVLPGVNGGAPLRFYRMTYEPEGREHGGYTDILIDPDTNLITAWRNGSWYPILPGDILPDLPASPAAPLRIVDRHQEVGGFVLPLSYRSGPPQGDPVGMHLIHDIAIQGEFDRRKLMPPDNAEIVFDRSAQ
ncbi:MAG: hypothetical protein Tsb0010_04490 [Parvularculaceae bacterium]